VLKAKKNLRLIEVKSFGAKPLKADVDLKKVVGGILMQDRDTVRVKESDLKIVTKVSRPRTRSRHYYSA